MKKKFLYVIVVVAAMIFSVTTISAQIDIKGSLKSWYDQKNEQQLNKDSEKIAKKIDSFEQNIQSYTHEMAKKPDHDFTHFLKRSISQSQEKIVSQQNKYEQTVNNTKNELLLLLEEDSETYEKEKEAEIADDLENSVDDLLNDILSSQ